MSCRVVKGELSVRTSTRFQVIDVTRRIEEWLADNRTVNGILTAFVSHTTAAIAVNEAESGLLEDILDLLKELTYEGKSWRHNRIDVNAHAHLSNVLVGHAATVPVWNGRMQLGTWQRILFIELDGPRSRRIKLTFVGE